MRIAVLCDGATLTRWQRAALARIEGDHELYLMVARGGPPPRRSPRHWAYYALNLLAVRNRETQAVPFPERSFAAAGRIEFTPGSDGAWATLPGEAIEWLKANDIDAVVKFALDLLRIPPAETLAVPILSFHHGDPSAYRGRPAGFHELANGERFVGQVVQILSNRLDSGEVLAFAESRAIAHSYRATLVEAFRLSPHLLPKALAALAAGRRVERPPIGPNYRLPGTLAVARFVARTTAALARRIGYGLLVEKRWEVASVAVAGDRGPLAALEEAGRGPGAWQVPEIRGGHSFYADPFFLADGAIIAEALDRRRGKGALVRIDGDRRETLTDPRRHFSYPFPHGGLIVPETAGWSRPAAYRIAEGRLDHAFDLDIDAARLLDPTVIERDGRTYLFANDKADGGSILHLWHAAGLDRKFERHPCSPVRISARGSRMAGRVARWGDAFWRFGQDWRGGYGDGVVAFRIVALSPDEYEEREEGSFAFAGIRGPHTVDRQGERLLFDFYRERRSLMAAPRRLLARL
jgi:hypothetical protein